MRRVRRLGARVALAGERDLPREGRRRCRVLLRCRPACSWNVLCGSLSPPWQAHQDEHLAAKLQKEEDQLGRLLGPQGRGGGGGGSGKKRAGAGGGTGSKQGTLTAAFGKRPKP